MNLSGALSNALSGLTVASQMAETVSNNVSNAMTEGYAPRDVRMAQRMVGSVGAGARVGAIVRQSDPVLLASRRLADAELGQASVRADFLTQIEKAIGLPDDPGSLNARVADFGAALIQAGSRPDSEARLQLVVDSARSVADRLNSASDTVQSQRMQADRNIASSVDFINTSLAQIAELNGQILRVDDTVRDASGMLDQRQRLIDGIADLVPLREVPRDNGSVALYTTGGAVLLDITPAELGFTSAGIITSDMSLGGGTLSGLTINGKSVSTSLEQGPISGGRLAALFDVRDVQAPTVQTRLDAVARDLIERFEDPAVDPTLTAGDPGLFTDNGAAFVPADEVGLAGRIALSALVDPQAGGALWRIRDGLGATAPGSPGDSTLLNAFSDALGQSRLPATGGFVAPQSATGIAADLLSGVSVSRQGAESQKSFASAQSETLVGMELANGVDTDAEMQKLLLIEKVFGANARVVSTIDELIQTLLRI